jgi:hypothetical protein
MSDFNDKGVIIITGHILIRDTETEEILLNKSECSLITEIDNINKDDTNNEG